MNNSQQPGTLTILQPGLFTLIVDQGRPSTRHLGVPLGGAADRNSLAIGNALVGNAPFTPALEVSFQGPLLLADVDLTCVVFGAPVSLHIEEKHVPSQRPFLLPAHHHLRIGSITEGARAYFCVCGGAHANLILESYSSLAPLEKGDQLTCHVGKPIRRFMPEGVLGWNEENEPIRILPGAQRSWFANDAPAGKHFAVLGSSNRMGIRLEGEPFQMPERELVSEPVCPGSIQVTRDGQLVILGVDGQTIGGYPKIAQIASIDLDRVGQLRPGETVSFQWITREEAQQLWQKRERELRQWLMRLQVTTSL